MQSAAQRKVDLATPTRFLSIRDFDASQLEACLGLAAELKHARAAGVRHVRPLKGKHIALLFEKPSLRTRSTFQIAVRELGGDVIEPPQDVALGGILRVIRLTDAAPGRSLHLAMDGEAGEAVCWLE